VNNEQQESRRTRRGLLKIATVGFAGLVGASLGKTTSAQAADGAPLVVGHDTGSAGTTSLTSTSSAAGKPVLQVTGTNADYGLQASASGIGVYGSGPIGVYGDGAVGGVFSGSDASLSLTPRSASGPPTGSNLKGDIALDADGVLWMCVADGNPGPGTWIRISHGGVRPLASPFRVLATSEPGAGGKLAAGETRRVQIVGAVPNMPDRAQAMIGNLTVYDTEGGGYVTAYPAGTPRPPTSNINWNTPNVAIANALTVGLNGGAIELFADAAVPAGGLATNVILDVAAYVL
jgi:hypothetical protein